MLIIICDKIVYQKNKSIHICIVETLTVYITIDRIWFSKHVLYFAVCLAVWLQPTWSVRMPTLSTNFVQYVSPTSSMFNTSSTTLPPTAQATMSVADKPALRSAGSLTTIVFVVVCLVLILAGLAIFLQVSLSMISAPPSHHLLTRNRIFETCWICFLNAVLNSLDVWMLLVSTPGGCPCQHLLCI